MKNLIIISLILFYFILKKSIFNIKKRLFISKCKVIPDNAIKLYDFEHNETLNFFNCAIKEYKNHGLNIKISKYDLFHYHICKSNIIIFHCMEYPKDYHSNLGYCQAESNLKYNKKDFLKRNLVYDLQEKKYYLGKNTGNFVYMDCSLIEDRYIDPDNFNTYKVKYI